MDSATLFRRALPRLASSLCIGLCLAACASRKGSGTIDGVDHDGRAADRLHAQAPFDEQARLAARREQHSRKRVSQLAALFAQLL